MPGMPGLIAVLRRGEGLCVGEGVVERPPFLLPHIEDGALFHQAGQRFLCAGMDGLQASAVETPCARRKANCSL